MQSYRTIKINFAGGYPAAHRDGKAKTKAENRVGNKLPTKLWLISNTIRTLLISSLNLWFMARSQPQQTIKLAIDCKTGEPIPAESLLTLEEAKFSALRRSTLAARVERKRGGSAMPFQCAICKQEIFSATQQLG